MPVQLEEIAWMVDREDKEGGSMQERMRWESGAGKAIAVRR